MKFKIILPVVFTFLLMFFGCSNEKTNPMVGRQAPGFAVTMLEGKEISLNDLKGMPVLLEFWAPWCPGCLENIPPLKKLYSRYGDKVSFIAVSSELGKKTVKMCMKERGISYPVALANKKLLSDYLVSGIPVTILIDGDGVVRFHHIGQFSYGRVEKVIESLL